MHSQITPLRFYDIQAQSLMELLKDDGWIIDSVSNPTLMILR